MLSPAEFVKKLEKDSEPLYQFSENKVKEFYDKQPSNTEIAEYFFGRLVNERANCTEIAKRVYHLPGTTSPEEMFLLCKQAMDEAKHFGFVKEIIEYLTGEPVDVPAIMKKIADRNIKNKTGGPAQLLAKYEAATDPIAVAVYQFIGEGRAARNWDMMAKCATDPLIRKRYAEIAKDEKFHSKIGRNSLLKLLTSIESQRKASILAEEFRQDLFEVGCAKQHMPLNSTT